MEQRSKRIRIAGQILFALLLCLLVFAADRALIHWISGLYQQQENLLYATAGDEESIEHARYFKQQPSQEAIEQGRTKLAALGYDSEISTVQKSQQKRITNRVYGYSILILALFFLLWQGISHLYVSAYKKQLHTISHVLSRLQENEQSRPADKLHPKAALLGAWEEEEIVQENLDSLKELWQLQNARMEQEKEGTKRLVTDISHQMKTPVAALQNSLELLQEEDLTEEEHREFLARASAQMNSLSSLVASMVDISRMEKGMIHIEKKTADLLATIRSAVSRVWEKAEDKGITIEFENGGEISAYMLCHDPRWTSEALSNILDNAVKYSPAQSQIRLRLSFLTMYLKIEIEDEGIGVPKDEYHRIFQRFYRGRDVQNVEGSGVGLYLAREILERQGGSVMVRARHEGGSIFVVQLPLLQFCKKNSSPL